MKHPDEALAARLRAFYSEQHLALEHKDALKHQISSGFAPSRPPVARQQRRLLRHPAVLLGLLVVLVASIAVLGTVQIRQANTHAIAAEIALNHRKQLDIEVASNQWDVLQGAMPKLDFTLAASARPALAGLDLQGARYCSIGSAIAAQLRLQDAQGGRYTLYQFRAPDRLLQDEATLRIAAEQATEQDVEVILWQENGLLFGLATTDGS